VDSNFFRSRKPLGKPAAIRHRGVENESALPHGVMAIMFSTLAISQPALLIKQFPRLLPLLTEKEETQIRGARIASRTTPCQNLAVRP
jgi:hypothetical protein